MVRGVRVAGQSLGGMTSLDSLNLIQKQWQTFTHTAFHFRQGDHDIVITSAAPTASETEVVLDLASLDIQAAINQAYDYGHTGPWWMQAWHRLSGLLGRHHDYGRITVDTTSLSDLLKAKLNNQEVVPISASITITDGQVSDITPSADGHTIDYAGAIRQAVDRARHLNTTPVIVSTVVVKPEIVSSPELQAIAEREVPEVINRAPLTLTSDDKHWTVTQTQLAKLLGFAKNADGQIHVGFDTTKTSDYLKKIAKDIEIAPQNAKFTIVDGQVKEFQTSVVGKTLDIEASLTNLETSVIQHTQSSAQLVVNEAKPVSDTVAANNLGITELVAEATTNFHGSPTNRRYNLTLGAKLLNGLLIAPGDEFSLVKALGPIDAAHGWKPELVIKGSAITPEFGGGLCQVGTTTFRVALNAGLPIVERHNHSLRIRYYEPPVGLDATIYEPKPDLRFTNDYDHYLLLQTEVNGNDLTFRFYGTKDGRSVDIPEPKVYNRTPIPATKTIEVDDLKPGEKECQTPGHPGADATATYTVTKADGTSVTQTFQSHYRALGVVCRVGKKKTTTPPPTATNTNTDTTPTE